MVKKRVNVKATLAVLGTDDIVTTLRSSTMAWSQNAEGRKIKPENVLSVEGLIGQC